MREKYLLELGGENTALGKYEALELFKLRRYHTKLENDYVKIVVISTSKEIGNRIINRLSMTKRLSKIIFSSSKDNIKTSLNDLDKIDIGEKSFTIRQVGDNKL